MPDDSMRTAVVALGAGIGVTLAKVGAAFSARIDIDDGLRGAQVKELVRGIESGMKHEAEEAFRVDIVPIGQVTI
jgi:hypothetical protein